jgi:hypothetical protein
MKRHLYLNNSRGPAIGGQWPLVRILVRSRYGDFIPIRFCVDSGADLSALPLALAQRHGIAVPQSEHSRGTEGGLAGPVARYRGVIQVRLFGEPFTWPCEFIDSPGRPDYGVLGRSGFLSAFNFCIKGPFLIIEPRRDHLPPWQRALLSLVPSWSRLHPPGEPLCSHPSNPPCPPPPPSATLAGRSALHQAMNECITQCIIPAGEAFS